jgi:hypothetical protein
MHLTYKKDECIVFEALARREKARFGMAVFLVNRHMRGARLAGPMLAADDTNPERIDIASQEPLLKAMCECREAMNVFGDMKQQLETVDCGLNQFRDRVHARDLIKAIEEVHRAMGPSSLCRYFFFHCAPRKTPTAHHQQPTPTTTNNKSNQQQQTTKTTTPIPTTTNNNKSNQQQQTRKTQQQQHRPYATLYRASRRVKSSSR